MVSGDSATCTECYASDDLVFFRDLPMNEKIREFVRQYIGPPKLQHLDLACALADWGQDFRPEDIV